MRVKLATRISMKRTFRSIAGVPNSCDATFTDTGLEVSIGCVRSTGSDRLFSGSTGDADLGGDVESASF